MSISRRDLIKSAGALTFLSGFAGLSNLAFADINGTDKRFVLVILRGGMDGLAAVAPYGDPNYEAARGEGLAYAPNEVVNLDGFFGLSSSLDSLLPIYTAKQLAVFHAVSLPYRSRSHFDSQNVLENGTAFPSGVSGWLNNALSLLGASRTDAMALNQQIPLVLQGKLGVASWAPKGTSFDLNSLYISSISKLYKQDSLLGDSFAAGIAAQQMAEASLPKDDMMASKGAKDADALVGAAKAAAAFLVQKTGPKVAVLEAGGWDTHVNQGKAVGHLATRLKYLGDSLGILRDDLTKGGVWDKTVVVVVTEFGRTVHENGTKGTDHGTGGVSFVMGGAVKGGKVFGSWEGLSTEKLFKGRDLMPTTDMRSIFKTVLVKHFGASSAAVDASVFPVPSKNPNFEPTADPVSANVMNPVSLIDGLFV
jgi:uncharacterized protein (DUF1501 family)